MQKKPDARRVFIETVREIERSNSYGFQAFIARKANVCGAVVNKVIRQQTRSQRVETAIVKWWPKWPAIKREMRAAA